MYIIMFIFVSICRTLHWLLTWDEGNDGEVLEEDGGARHLHRGVHHYTPQTHKYIL